MWSATLVCLVLASSQVSVVCPLNPFSVTPIEEVVKALGYPIERHNIKTADGYVLTYHRVPHGLNDTSRQPRKVVLFCNGILLSSASTMLKRGDFAFSLADAGFDVWLGNYRGNMYSRRHDNLDPDHDNQFWDFSLHELGSEDLPSSIDYILEHTGQPQLIYIGASMGTTMFWVLGATKPEYMGKVEAMVAIAPVARPSHSALVNSWARYSTLHATFSALKALNYNELMPYSESTGALMHLVCTNVLLRPLCFRALYTFSHLTGQNWDVEKLLEATKYGPAGISTKIVFHFMQIARSNRFQKYDYGRTENLERYQTDIPPEYDLKKITCKSIYFVHSDADQIATKEDVEWLSAQLPLRPTRILEAVNHLGHLGLGLDRDVSRLLVKPLVRFLQRLP